MVLQEINYKEAMNDVVLPYNRARETDCYVERISGEKIHLCTYKADEPIGTVVISHGFTESIPKYQEVIYYFLNEGYHVYMAEHCGHGRSYRLNDDLCLVYVDSYKRYIEDFLFIAHLCKEAYPQLPMYLFAHSMGGGIGATAIAKEPQLFEKAILTSPMIRPQTGNIPWGVTRLIAQAMTKKGKEGDYIMGQKPYEGKENFEDGCATSEARFNYYRELRDQDVYLQTCAASYAWAREAVKMNDYLDWKGWREVEIPVLLFQAVDEALVSKTEQERYIRRIFRLGSGNATLVKVPGSKHEIFNATSEVQEKYWKKIMKFLKA